MINIQFNGQLKAKVLRFFTGLTLLTISQLAYSHDIKIHPNTIISSPKKYESVTLDMTNGSFIIRNNATLTINNSVIKGTLSKDIPVLFMLENGKINLAKNKVNIDTKGIASHPYTQSLQNVIQVGSGGVTLSNNNFKIESQFTAGLLITTETIPTSNFQIVNNSFEQFHGVLYLITSNYAVVADNVFTKNSYGHIVLMGNNGRIIHNTILFSGNDHLGNSIDVINSDNVVINKNLLFTPTCHAIYILNCRNLVIDKNRISGGITYAMNILSYPEISGQHDEYVNKLFAKNKIKNTVSDNIVITNNFMSQNRYGLAISDTDKVVVKNNYFIQRFQDDASRKFWTDNNILLQHVSHLTWERNFYKEAYSQEIGGDNSQSEKFVLFPQTGGVSL